MGIINWKGISVLFYASTFVMFLLWSGGCYYLISLINSKFNAKAKFVLLLSSSLSIVCAFVFIIMPDNDWFSRGFHEWALHIVMWGAHPLIVGFGLSFFCTRLSRSHNPPVNVNRRRFLHASMVLFPLSVTTGIFGKSLFFPSKRLRINRIRFSYGALKETYCLLFVSDFHAGFFLSSHLLEAIKESVQETPPDCILIGGDFVNHHPDDLQQLDELLRVMTSTAPVVSVFGNHDHYAGIRLLNERLREYGIYLLRDSMFQLKDELVIVGTRDYIVEGGGSCDALAQMNSTQKALLLTHAPDFLIDLPSEEKDRVFLALAGHTHGGQVRLPFVGPLVSQTNTPFVPGLNYGADHPPIFLTNGVGYAGLPIRVNAPPEMTYIQI